MWNSNPGVFGFTEVKSKKGPITQGGQGPMKDKNQKFKVCLVNLKPNAAYKCSRNATSEKEDFIVYRTEDPCLYVLKKNI